MKSILISSILVCIFLFGQAQEFQTSSGYVVAKEFRVTRALRDMQASSEIPEKKEEYR
jgi:hypothetical protein